MKLLITGGTGFIGRNLIQSLPPEENEIHVIVRGDSDLSKLPNSIKPHINNGTFDCINLIVKESSPDVVIHFASIAPSTHHSLYVEQLISTNIGFGTLLLESMKNNGCRKFINTGTFWQHYKNEEYNPVDLYAATKKAFEDICFFYHKAHEFNIINLHLFDTYGEKDDRLKLLNLLKKTYIDQSELDMSPGYQEILLVHISDIIQGYFRAMEILQESVENIFLTFGLGDKNQVCSVVDLIQKIESITRKKLNVRLGRRNYRSREMMKMWDTFTTIPGWRQKKNLDDGLRCLFDIES